MDCKRIIDRVVEARDLQDRHVGQVFGALKPSELANIDRGIRNTCNYVDGLVARYESMPDPVQSLALSGDMLSDIETTYEGLQATFALFQLYTLVLSVYRNQQGSPTPLIRLPGKFSSQGQIGGKQIGEFIPDVWDGRAQRVWSALVEYTSDGNGDEGNEWSDVMTAYEVREVWDKLKPLIPTTGAIDMANMRKILAKDRSRFVGDVTKIWRDVLSQAISKTRKREAYSWATGYPGHGAIEADTDLDKVSIFIDDLHSLSGWRPSPGAL